jgi:hypothetical protein
VTLRNVLRIINKGGAGSGFHGHAGIPGKVGGSTSLGLSGAVAAKFSLPPGEYPVVWSGKPGAGGRGTGVRKLETSGPGHALVRVNDAYHVIKTSTATTVAPTPPKTPATVAPTPTSVPAAVLGASRVEQEFAKATPEAKEFATKYGLLANDSTAMKYLNEMASGGKLSDRSATYAIDNAGHHARQILDASAGRQIFGDKSLAQSVLERGKWHGQTFDSSKHKVVPVADPLGKGTAGYAVVPKGFKPKDLSDPKAGPDFTRMTGLTTASAAEKSKVQSTMDERWNHHDNGEIKAKVLNVFKVTNPDELHNTYQERLKEYGNERKLWHGRDQRGAAGIAKNGVFATTTGVVGQIYGRGAYFSDSESKAIQYAHSGSGSKMASARGVLLLMRTAVNGMGTKSLDTSPAARHRPGFKPIVDIDDSMRTLKVAPVDGRRSNEYVIKDAGATIPMLWIDEMRTPR